MLRAFWLKLEIVAFYAASAAVAAAPAAC